MEEDLRARLLADAGVSALVGTRVTWIDRPQSLGLPAVTLQLVSPGRSYTYSGADDLADSRVQVDCWGASYGAAKSLSRAVTGALEPSTTQGGTRFVKGFLEEGRDLPPEELPGGVKVYRVSLDFIIWSRPAA